MRAALLLVAAMAVATEAHLCLLNPIQRGGVSGSDKPDASACLVVSGPCGSAPSGPVTYFRRGTMQDVTFLKNVNHWNPSAPGNFSVFGINPAVGLPNFLGSITDANSPDLTNYTMSVWVPETTDPGNYILQVIYYTNNPAAPPAFYQCADVGVF